MRILNYFRILYYSLILRFESYELPFRPNIQRQQDRKNDKLARGVKQLVKHLRSLSYSDRIKEDNILMQADRSKELTTMEKLANAQAAAKLIAGPREESEESMASTFVKNQGKYKLQAQKRKIYKDLHAGLTSSKAAQFELRRINLELKKYE